MNNIDVSVIIPVYNSYYSIDEVVSRTAHTLEQQNLEYEIILVNDFSWDNSLRKLHELNKMNTKIKVLDLQKNYGQQEAIKQGMYMAKGEYIINIDDDLEHHPEDILLLIKEIHKGYDVVYGVCENKTYSLYRKMGSKLIDMFFTVCLHKPKNIRVSSFRIMHKDIVYSILQDQTPFVYISAIILRITQNIGNVSIKHSKRKYGNSNYNIWKLIKLSLKLFIYYRIKINAKRSLISDKTL